MQLLPVISFGLVGCTGIAVDFSVTWLIKEKLKWNRYIASIAGFCFAVVNNYFLNRQFTFTANATGLPQQFIQFTAISIIGLLLSTLLLLLLQKKTALNFYISKLAVIAGVFIWNYSANALFTFRQ